MDLRISRSWLTWAVISGLVGLVGKELVLELVFGSAADWLKSNLWVVGDFLEWRFSGLALGIVILITVWILGIVAERRQAIATGRAAPVAEQVEQAPTPKPQSKKSQHIEVTDDNDYIKHDGVLWEWRGDEDRDGHPAMEGPLCPRDAVPLQFREAPEEHRELPPLGGSKYRPLEAAKTAFSLPPIGFGRRAATRDVNENDTIGGFSGVGLLYCLECKDDYRLSTGFSFAGKTVGQSRREASMRFEGKRRRRGLKSPPARM